MSPWHHCWALDEGFIPPRSQGLGCSSWDRSWTLHCSMSGSTALAMLPVLPEQGRERDPAWPANQQSMSPADAGGPGEELWLWINPLLLRVLPHNHGPASRERQLGAELPLLMQVLPGPHAENCWKIPRSKALLINQSIGATAEPLPGLQERDASSRECCEQPLHECCCRKRSGNEALGVCGQLVWGFWGGERH